MPQCGDILQLMKHHPQNYYLERYYIWPLQYESFRFETMDHTEGKESKVRRARLSWRPEISTADG